MEGVSMTMVAGVAVLTVFLCFITALKYAVPSGFVRTRLVMTLFFFFIVVTLTLSFWQYTLASLVYTVPAALLGACGGYFLGVRAEQEKLMRMGLGWYREHFAHVHAADLRALTWWSVVNFYSVMGALLLINLVGLSIVLFKNTEWLALAACAVGAFLLGTIAPYLIHLWSIKAAQNKSSTMSDA